jgi:hypothetical protein
MHDQPTGSWWPFLPQLIPLAQLRVERFDGTSGFQRPQSERFVAEQCREFDPIRFEPLTVIPVYKPDGTFAFYSVIDGAHRAAMAGEKGYDAVPCNVLNRTLTYEGRAWQFYKLNRDRRQVNVRDGTRALYESKDETILKLIEILGEHGFYLDGYRPVDPNGHRALYAIHALRRQCETDQNGLGRALYVLEEWRTIGRKQTQANLINALCFLSRKVDVDVERLRGVLRANGPTTLEREARDQAAQLMQTGISERAMRMVLVRHYNHGLRRRRINLDENDDE